MHANTLIFSTARVSPTPPLRLLCGLVWGLVLFFWLALPPKGLAQKSLTYTVKKGDTLSDIALQYHVSVGQLRQWNKLPGDKILQGQQLRLYPRGAPRWYVVRSGDTLSEIALRFNVSMATLRRLNTLSQDRIYPGQRIMLRDAPGNKDPSRTYTVKRGDTLWDIARLFSISISELKSLNDLQGDTISPGELLITDEPAPETPAEEPRFEYVVQKGDTLSEIAQNYNVSPGLISQLNDLKGDRIYPGDILQLQPSSLEEAVHMVRAGDTLSTIALKYQTTVADLMDINGLTRTRIQVGQKLRLKRASSQTHMVERGDALWEIASAYGMSVTELKALNDLSSNLIYPGQELRLAVQAPAYRGTYTVKPGDYLNRIARLHQMSVKELKQVNALRSSVIHPGDTLRVRALLKEDTTWSQSQPLDWEDLLPAPKGIKRLHAKNGPYYAVRPKAERQSRATYYEGPRGTPLGNYRRAKKLWRGFEEKVSRLPRISNKLKGWNVVLDPGHGGLDPGAIVRALDGNRKAVYVVEDEYVYDVALRVYILLRRHGAQVALTLLSPNHLLRHSDPPRMTFVNEKNEIYNSYALNKSNKWRCWPSGGRGGNLYHRVKIARDAFRGVPKNRRIFLSLHADIEPHSPDAAQLLYYKSRTREDARSKAFAKQLLPALGAGAHIRGRNLAVLRDNPAYVSVLIEIRNLAYTDHAWALRFEELRQRDAQKIVKGLLDCVNLTLSASLFNRISSDKRPA